MTVKRKACHTPEDGPTYGPKRHPFPTQEDIDSGLGEYYKAGNNTIYERTYYTKGKVYIVDDKNIDDFDSGPRNPWQPQAVSPRVSKCTAMAACFRDISPYQVCGVPPQGTQECWDAYWDGEISKWRSGELIVVYYHGNAGGNGDKYTWYPSDGVAANIDAHKFMRKLINSGKDLLMIIEAHLPTRFHEKSSLSRLVKNTGNAVAIYASGHPGQQTDDFRMDGDFTEKLLANFASLMFYNAMIMSRWSTKGWSIPELVRGEEDMQNNPYNMELMRPSKEDTLAKIIESESDDSIIYRILCDKHRIGYGKKLIFCRDTIEDTQRERQLKTNRENRLRDEGFVENSGADIDSPPPYAICGGATTSK